MDVVVLRWPEEEERRTALRTLRRPRLLLLEDDRAPPVTVDPLEDWIRLPAGDDDVRARLAALEQRTPEEPGPEIDEHGVLRHRGRWVALAPVELALARTLLEHFMTVVSRDVLSRRAWPQGAPRRNALDVQILRLRRRVGGVGLEIQTVRSRGYLLQPAANSP
ncbi:MAG: helix-turn-helix domain-containing protein [Actinobacteria bacterium]|nr:MAG: helix-turn-helix domain-containing protein [Actinomycetota bacterium]